MYRSYENIFQKRFHRYFSSLEVYTAVLIGLSDESINNLLTLVL